MICSLLCESDLCYDDTSLFHLSIQSFFSLSAGDDTCLACVACATSVLASRVSSSGCWESECLVFFHRATPIIITAAVVFSQPPHPAYTPASAANQAGLFIINALVIIIIAFLVLCNHAGGLGIVLLVSPHLAQAWNLLPKPHQVMSAGTRSRDAEDNVIVHEGHSSLTRGRYRHGGMACVFVSTRR